MIIKIASPYLAKNLDSKDRYTTHQNKPFVPKKQTKLTRNKNILDSIFFGRSRNKQRTK